MKQIWHRTVGCAALLAAGGSCTVDASPGEQADAPQVEVIQMDDAPPGLPFSSVVRVDNVLYLSGQVGNVPGTLELIEGGVEAETRQTLENIRSVLERAGSSMDRVVKCTVFLQNIEDYQAMNGVYASVFTESPPARSTVAGSGLAIGASVEIECIAVSG